MFGSHLTFRIVTVNKDLPDRRKIAGNGISQTRIPVRVSAFI